MGVSQSAIIDVTRQISHWIKISLSLFYIRPRGCIVLPPKGIKTTGPKVPMPFEDRPSAPRANIMRRNIAVIGAGISGMGAAHMLASNHAVTLFEAGKRIGGHARTVIAGKNGDQPVDTGFIVFNYANYPHLAELFKELDVPVVKSNMSFGASIDGGRLEYALHEPRCAVCAAQQRAEPGLSAACCATSSSSTNNALKVAEDQSLTIARIPRRDWAPGGISETTICLPLSGAIWSTPTEKIMDFPAHAMMQFFREPRAAELFGPASVVHCQRRLSVEYVHPA